MILEIPAIKTYLWWTFFFSIESIMKSWLHTIASITVQQVFWTNTKVSSGILNTGTFRIAKRNRELLSRSISIQKGKKKKNPLEDLNHIRSNISIYRQRIFEYPQGSLMTRTINGRDYIYLKYRKDRKVIQEYVSPFSQNIYNEL